MTLTSEEIAAIIGVLVVLGNAFAIWLSHQSTGKNIDQVSAKVDALSTPVTIVTGTASGPAGLVAPPSTASNATPPPPIPHG